MNTSQIECFVRVAEALNFQQAAQALHLSQPAVSKQIAALEDELGARLFVRTTRTVALTPAGELFLADARSILRLTYHSRQVIAETGRNRELLLRIGYTDSNELPRLIGALGRMREAHPGFQPLLMQDSWDSNLSRLEHGQIDLCFAFQDNKRHGKARFLPLTARRFLCLLPKGHPLAAGETVSYEQLRALPQVLCVPMALRSRFYNGENEQALPHEAGQEIVICQSAAEAYALVLAGFGYCLLPEHLVAPHPGLRFLRWERTAEMVHGAFYPEVSAAPLLGDFLRLLREGCGAPEAL